MDKTYTKQRLKLTLLYLAIISVIVIFFSIIVLQLQNQQFARFERFKATVRPTIIVNGIEESRPPEPDREKVEAVIAEAKAENKKAIIILDIFIVLGAAIISYYLSGRTLEPILETLQKQKQFVSDASHEIRTPLTTIKSEAEVIARSKKSTIDDYKEFTHSVIDEVDRLTELTNYLLETAKLENTTILSKPEVVVVSDLIHDVTTRFKTKLEEKKIHLEISATETNLSVKTHKIQLERTLSIFIDNAIKYNKPENGSIRITTGVKNNHTYIEITDTGVGIDKEHLSKICNRFYRVTEDRNIKGFGLGLSIAKQITEQLHINLKIKSTLGEGTSIICVFPKGA